MPIKDDFQKLKQVLLGTKTTSIDKKLDQAIDDITSYRAKSGRNGYIDLVKAIIAKSTSGFNIDQSFGGAGSMAGQGASPTAFGQALRISRYAMYDSIISHIGYCYRALDVIVDNVISPDDITKVSLDVKSTKPDGDDGEQTSQIKEIIKRLQIEKHLHFIVRNTLLYGDFFTEIADTKTAVTSKAYLAEKEANIQREEVEVYSIKIAPDHELKFQMDYTSLYETESLTEAEDEMPSASLGPEANKIKNKIPDELSLQNINLVFHHPEQVIKLQSEMYPVCFGYLIFPRMGYVPQLYIKDQAVNSICDTILQSLARKLPQIETFDKKEIVDIVKVMAATTKDHSKFMSIRYVPASKMQHFMRPTTKYYPYGESIFDAQQFTAKCLIAMETALTIARLSRSTEKRKIAVEIGLPRDAKAMVEKLKEEFRKRKISIDSFGTIDTIPSNITTFEDIYIPQKDGKAFVDISTFTEGNIDTRNKVDELKFLRDSTVASVGVPPAFIGLEENVNAKSTLAEENILFARTVLSHQKYLSQQLTSLVQKIYDTLDPEQALTILDYVTITFPQPKSLQFEREARYISELANLIETLERVGIPKQYTIKKYLPNIDWDDVKRYEIDDKVDKIIGTVKDDEMMMGSGMMGGGGSGGGY